MLSIIVYIMWCHCSGLVCVWGCFKMRCPFFSYPKRFLDKKGHLFLRHTHLHSHFTNISRLFQHKHMPSIKHVHVSFFTVSSIQSIQYIPPISRLDIYIACTINTLLKFTFCWHSVLTCPKSETLFKNGAIRVMLKVACQNCQNRLL